MIKISIKNIIAFRKKSDRSRKSFLKSINKVKTPDSEGGGNYWVRSLSAINNAFKTNDNQIIKDKIADISSDYVVSKSNQTKNMYQRNLAILRNYEEFDFSTWYPNKTLKIINKVSKKSVIEINRVPVQVLPNQIFTFKKNKIEYVGAVWFVAKLEGYNKSELGMFAEALFNFLSINFSEKYEVSPKNCLVVDVLNLDEVTYKMILDEEIPALLLSTIESIKANL